MPQPLPSASIDIERHTVVDYRPEGGELMVYIDWCHRAPVASVVTRTGRIEWLYAFGPSITTELHVFGDLVTVCGQAVPKHAEAALIAYVAGLFAADEEVAA